MFKARAVREIKSKHLIVHTYKVTRTEYITGVANVVTITVYNFSPFTPVLLENTPWKNRCRCMNPKDFDLWSDKNLESRIALVDNDGLCNHTYNPREITFTQGSQNVQFKVNWNDHKLNNFNSWLDKPQRKKS